MSLTEWAREILNSGQSDSGDPSGERPIAHPVDGVPVDAGVEIPESDSEYDIDVDHGRLQRSEAVHTEQDHAVINNVLTVLDESDLTTLYLVLDAGCGYGTVTLERFGYD